MIGPGCAARTVAAAALALVAAPAALDAHPPVSVVVTADGRVWFSDLSRIWVLETDGSFRVALRGVHAHELRLDETGRVCGDDVQNEGDDYRFRFWCLDRDGRTENVLDWTEGHPHVLGWTLTEPAGAGRYWALGAGGELRRIDRDGHADLSVVLGAEPVAPSWVVAEGEGAIVVRGGALLHVDATGRVTTLADGLISRTEAFDFLHDRHALMKPWHDPAGRLYVPVYAGQRVLRIDPGPARGARSEPSIVFRSEGRWSPVGGTFLADGTLWMLEWSASNEARLRRVDPDGGETVYGPPA